MRALIAILGAAIIFLMPCGGISYASRAAVKAEPKQVVGWDPNLFVSGCDGGREDALASPAVNQEIVGLLGDRLHALRDAGKLPFELRESDNSYAFSREGDNPVGLIALVVDDSVIDSQYVLNGTTYYKAIVLCGIDLMFCSAEDAKGGMRVLQTIPLRGHAVIGGDLNNLVTVPITLEQQQTAFAAIAARIIRDQLDFAKLGQSLQEVEVKKVLNETYQVTQVNISSNKAKQMFEGRLEEIEALLGGNFTSAYQKTTGKIVYPSLAGGSWRENAADNLWTMDINSPSGNKVLSMPAARYPIELELTGLAEGEIHTQKASTVKREWGYKAWLKKSPVMSKEQAEMTKIRTKQFSTNNSILVDDDDVFIELLIDLATDLASQKE